MIEVIMSDNLTKICVFYDGACPSCIKDRDNYLRLAGNKAQGVSWLDITHKEQELLALGIDPQKALKELHIQVHTPNSPPVILSELDAYIVLMQRTTLLKPLAWLIGLPVIRPILSRLYHVMVMRRLKRSQRL